MKFFHYDRDRFVNFVIFFFPFEQVKLYHSHLSEHHFISNTEPNIKSLYVLNLAIVLHL